MKINLFIIGAFLSMLTISGQSSWQVYPYSPSGTTLSFPIDDGKHTNLKYITEWWYLNMHLIGSSPDYNEYDVMLCYFSKPATMRIFNIADPVSGKFHTNVNKTPFVLSENNNHWELDYHIPFFISDQSSWTYPNDYTTFSYEFYAEEPGEGDYLDIKVVGNRPPLIVGKDGYVALGEKGDSSYYYSYTNMNVTGTITFDGVLDTISSGIGWIDRQWGPFIVGINSDNMYEWFSLQVDDPGITLGQPQVPSEFNIWQIFSSENTIPNTPNSRLVSAMYSDETQDSSSTFIFERTGYWHDTKENDYYSHGWRFINPIKDINIDIEPTIKDQVVDVTLIRFWEGGTKLKGTIGNQKVNGLGFAELVAGHDTKIDEPSAPSALSASNYLSYNYISWQVADSGTYPVAGYRVFRSTDNDGYWNYLATTTDLFYYDYTAIKDSNYYYTVTSFDNQTAISASKYATPVYCSSITNLELIASTNELVKIYPNPAKEVVLIELLKPNNLDANHVNLQIMNLEGQKVKEQILQADVNKIDVSELSYGVYYIKLFDSNNVNNLKLLLIE